MSSVAVALEAVSSWGSEHWSAKTQAAHISFLKDVLNQADRELRKATDKISELESQLAIAQESLRQMAVHNKKLASPEITLEADEVKILQALAEMDNFSYIHNLRNELRLEKAKMRLYCGRLEGLRLVDVHFDSEYKETIRLLHPGLEFLASRGLI